MASDFIEYLRNTSQKPDPRF